MWEGHYFSEELKYVESLGWKVELLDGLVFSRERIFDYYINKFYELKIKAEKEGNQESRYLAKLHLNSLYGFFGKSLEQYEITCTEKPNLTAKDTITIGSRYLNKVIKENPSRSSNVAIAAAVTSYARIHMIQFKTLDGVYYTDTDSIFIDRPLPDYFIGKMLGQMDNELPIDIEINRALFLGNKKYFLEYLNTVTGELIQKSVIAGISKNRLTFTDGLNIFRGNTIILPAPGKNNIKIRTNNFFVLKLKRDYI